MTHEPKVENAMGTTGNLVGKMCTTNNMGTVIGNMNSTYNNSNNTNVKASMTMKKTNNIPISNVASVNTEKKGINITTTKTPMRKPNSQSGSNLNNKKPTKK